MAPSSSSRSRLYLALSAGVALLFFTTIFLQRSDTTRAVLNRLRPQSLHDWKHAQETRVNHLQSVATWEKPKDLKVIGIVFYGRKRYVEVLNCYLQRNLVTNGGILDKIVFAAKTDNEDDLNYLDELLASNPLYSMEHHSEKGINFSQMYGACEPGAICVKIDDDVLYIEDSTIRSIVRKKVENPELLAVSANIVVNFATAWLHWHLGAVWPFLPEVDPPETSPDLSNSTDWRVSTLPTWGGPKDYSWKKAEPLLSKRPGHRWLPVPPTNPLSRKTPIMGAEPKLAPNGWHNWLLATQQHYSFFRNLENQELWRYNFETWNNMNERISINLFAFSGDDLAAMGPMPGADEQFWTMDYPKKTGRPFVIDGLGIAAHHGYASMSKQSEKEWRIEGTRVLSMYRAYAREKVCGK